jgi:crotonobetainyl-CoA:carnitine CoA-transferase CaiB-like acyl-CoA transferase
MQEQQGFFGSYRILDLTDEQAQLGGKLLADMGAEVIKVEPPKGDKTRFRGPFFHDEIGTEKSLYFIYFNTNKKSVTLNLESEDGKSLFLELAKRADAVMESLPVGYLKSLGLDYEELRKVNPKLVMASVSPFGRTGPYSSYQSCDLVNMAMSGYMQITGEPDGPPVRFGAEQSYVAASHCAAAATAIALFHCQTSGEGQYVDISVVEAVATYTQEALQAETWFCAKDNVLRSGMKSRRFFPFGCFQCKDGWGSIGAITAKEWDAFAEWVSEVSGEKEILDDMYKGGIYARTPYVDFLDPYVTDVFTSRLTRGELFHQGQQRGIVCLPVYDVGEVVEDPHFNARDFFQETGHPIVGKLRYHRGPYISHEVPWQFRRSAPLLGEHNEEIYCGELGFSKEKLTMLRSAGVI